MGSPFEAALAAARDTLQESNGVTVDYDNGSTTLRITAVPGQTPVETLFELGSIAEYARYQDWIIDPADLVAGGTKFEPERGHTITRTIDNNEHVHKVVQLPGGEMWRYSDSNRTHIRVHTELSDDG